MRRGKAFRNFARQPPGGYAASPFDQGGIFSRLPHFERNSLAAPQTPLPQRLIQILDQIVHMLKPDRDAQQVVGCARSRMLN